MLRSYLCESQRGRIRLYQRQLLIHYFCSTMSCFPWDVTIGWSSLSLSKWGEIRCIGHTRWNYVMKAWEFNNKPFYTSVYHVFLCFEGFSLLFNGLKICMSIDLLLRKCILVLSIYLDKLIDKVQNLNS